MKLIISGDGTNSFSQAISKIDHDIVADLGKPTVLTDSEQLGMIQIFGPLEYALDNRLTVRSFGRGSGSSFIMKKRGFTVVELLQAILVVFLVVGVIWLLAHFIARFW
jgi:hypothetical protein